MKRIDDTREFEAMSIGEADKLFEEIAVKETEIKKENAICDRKIAKLKSDLETKTAQLKADVAVLSKRLSEYVKNHKDRFIKPRQRTTNFGKYGVRTVTELVITDEHAIVEFAKENNLPLFKVEYKVDKKAIEKLIVDGKEIPGAYRKVGDIISYNVAKVKEDEKESVKGEK